MVKLTRRTLMKKAKRKNGKKLKKTGWIRKAAKAHACITVFFLVFYLVASIIADPRFLVRDFREKYSSLADELQISVSLRVPGPPEKPLLSLATGCDGNDAPYINLNWNQTADTDSFDIYRDGLILVSNLSQTAYKDQNVLKHTSYDYKVVANGSAGSTESEIVSETTGDCQNVIVPYCSITSIGGVDLVSHPGEIKTDEKSPLFTGTTNIPNALIQITIGPGTIISATTSANQNGYWFWQTPEKLPPGHYDATVIATDPINGAITATVSANFQITEAKEQKKEKEKEKKTSFLGIAPFGKHPPEKLSSPEEKISKTSIIVSVKNQEKIVYAGDKLNFRLELKTNDPFFTGNPRMFYFEVKDDHNKILTGFQDKIDFSKESFADRSINIPALSQSGRYRIIVKTYNGNALFVADDYFTLKELPLINLGGGTVITLTWLASFAGWILFCLLFILLLFLILLTFEHHLAKQALFQVTEKYLNRKGFFTRKGVSR
jgi:hypothetical protein